MSISSWASIELKHGRSSLSDVQWGRKVMQSIDVDDYITLSQMMNKKSHPNYDINIQTNIYGYAGYMWTVSIHQFLGDTALHFALRTKKLYCVYMLLYLGAEVTVLNDAGERAVDMLQGIYNMTYENMKYDAKRQLIKHTPLDKLPLLPKEFLPTDTSNVKKEAWSLMMQGCLLYTKLPKALQRKKDKVNTSHTSPTTRRHLSFNLTSTLKNWKQSINEDGHILYINELTGETSFAPPQGWSNVLAEINRIRMPTHKAFVTRPSPESPTPPIEDIWSRGDVSDITSIIERQKQRYYQRKLPATQFTAQGLSLLNSVKLNSSHHHSIAHNPNPSYNPNHSNTYNDQQIDELAVPLPAASLMSFSHQNDPSIPHPNSGNPSHSLLHLPSELLEAKGIANLPFVKEKEDIQRLEKQVLSSLQQTEQQQQAKQPSAADQPTATQSQSALPFTASDRLILNALATTNANHNSDNNASHSIGNTNSNGGKPQLVNLMDGPAASHPPVIAPQQVREIHEVSTRHNLKYMKIGNMGAKSLASAFTDDPIVRKVILANARIADLGMHFLFPALNSMWRLKYLDLSGNVLTATSAQLLVDTLLAKPKQLQVLSLTGNRLGFAGVLTIIHGLFDQQQVLDDQSMPGHKRRGVCWCSVKNNELAVRDREALVKLFEEEDFEAKKASSSKIKGNGLKPADRYPSIFQKRIPRERNNITARSDGKEEEEEEEGTGRDISGKSSGSLFNRGASECIEDGKYDDYEGDEDSQGRSVGRADGTNIGRGRSQSVESQGNLSTGHSESSGVAGTGKGGKREWGLQSTSVEHDNVSLRSHSTIHSNNTKSTNGRKKNMTSSNKTSSPSKKQVMFHGDPETSQRQSANESNISDSDSERGSDAASLSSLQANHLAGFEEDMDHWLTSSSDDDSSEENHNKCDYEKEREREKMLQETSLSEVSESLLRRRLRHQFALTVIV